MMKLTKIVLLVAVVGLVLVGCSVKNTLVPDNEAADLLNNYSSTGSNNSPQLIPIRTSPTGATVLVDGAEQGQTPFDLKLKRGAYEYKIEIVKDGYRSEETVLTGKLYKFKSIVLTGWYYKYHPNVVNIKLTKE